MNEDVDSGVSYVMVGDWRFNPVFSSRSGSKTQRNYWSGNALWRQPLKTRWMNAFFAGNHGIPPKMAQDQSEFSNLLWAIRGMRHDPVPFFLERVDGVVS